MRVSIRLGSAGIGSSNSMARHAATECGRSSLRRPSPASMPARKEAGYLVAAAWAAGIMRSLSRRVVASGGGQPVIAS